MYNCIRAAATLATVAVAAVVVAAVAATASRAIFIRFLHSKLCQKFQTTNYCSARGS